LGVHSPQLSLLNWLRIILQKLEEVDPDRRLVYDPFFFSRFGRDGASVPEKSNS
jgi:hypothetical protein